MSDLSAFIKEELAKRVNDYTSSPNYLIEHYNTERQNIESYNGRQLLEMLQNADDASALAKEKKALIRLKGNELTISNNGEAFDEDGFSSLIYINRSGKPMKKDMIGQKGLGFRSILSWAESIIIESAENRIGFSQQRANKFLEKLIENNPFIGQFLKEKSPIPNPIAVLRIPQLLPASDQKFLYDTSIIIQLNKSVIKDVQDQMNDLITMETMIFLNHLECIEIENPQKHIAFYRDKKKDHITVSHHDFNKNKSKEKLWHINRKKGVYKDKSYELAVAWNDSLDDKSNVLYSHFKTEVKIPFPALIHGTFELTPDRNGLVMDTLGQNKFLIGKLSELLIETAVKITALHPVADYQALQLLDIDFNSLDEKLIALKFPETITEGMKKATIYPNVNGKYFNYENQPVFYKSPVSQVLKGNDVNDLLLWTEDKDLIALIESLGSFDYHLENYAGMIRDRLSGLPVNDLAKLFYHLFHYKAFRDKLNAADFKRTSLPAFLPDPALKPIPWDKVTFVLDQGDIDFELPDSLDIKSIHSGLSKSLLLAYNTNKYDVITDDLSLLSVKSYSFEEICHALVNHYAANNSMESVIELHSYLFKLYKKESTTNPAPPVINSASIVKVIVHKKQISAATEAYFGKNYGHPLTEQLYHFDKSKIIAGMEQFGVLAEEQLVFKAYLKWLGVAESPRYKLRRFTTLSGNLSNYCEFVYRSFDYKKALNNYNESYKNYQDFAADLVQTNYVLIGSFDQLEDILQKNKPEHIFKWILSDRFLRDTLEKNIEIGAKATIEVKMKIKQYDRLILAGQIRSYTRWLFSTIAWLPVESVAKRASPEKCCLSRTVTPKYSPYVERPSINMAELADKLNITETTAYTLLLMTGVHREIGTFSMSVLYKMLLGLAETDKELSAAPAVYRDIISNFDENKLDINHPDYKAFIATGKVLCSKGPELNYFDVAEAFYINTKSFGQNVLKRFPLITVDRKRGPQKVQRLLGAKPLENISFNILSLPTLHNLSPYFQAELNRFKAYVYVLRMDKDTSGDIRSRVKRLNVDLVLDVDSEFKHQDFIERFVLDAYEFIGYKNKNTFLLKVPETITDLNELRGSVAFCDAIAEIFTASIALEEQRSFIRELYSVREFDREELLLKEIQHEDNGALVEARNVLQIVEDVRLSFWKAFVLALPKKIKVNLLDETSLTVLLNDKLHIERESVEKYRSPELYMTLNDMETQELFYGLFKSFLVDYKTFHRHFSGLDFVRYFKNQFEDTKAAYRQAVAKGIFEKLLTQDINEKKRYFELFERYENLYYMAADGFQVDFPGYFKEMIKRNLDLTLDVSGLKFSHAEIITANLNIFKAGYETVVSRFIERKDIQALLLFNEQESLTSIYREYLKKQQATEASGAANQIKFNGKSLQFNDYPTLAAELEILIGTIDLKIRGGRTLATPPSGKTDRGNKGRSPGSRKVNFGSVTEEQVGFVTEYLAYKALKVKFGEEQVEWVSENAFRANKDLTTEAGNGYDFRVYDGNKVRFVEVKGIVRPEDGFKMSGNELATALDFPEKYDLLIIEHPLSESPALRYLKSPFRFRKNESLFENNQFRLVTDNYIMKFRWSEK